MKLDLQEFRKHEVGEMRERMIIRKDILKDEERFVVHIGMILLVTLWVNELSFLSTK